MTVARPNVGKAASAQSVGGNSVLVQRKCACGGTSGLSGECERCRKERRGVLRRRATGPEATQVPELVHQVLGQQGQPLERATRAFMEPRFGHDFATVRIHNDGLAAASAEAVNARAYAVGHHIAFAAGEYRPETSEGRRLLAHELAHVTQQSTDTSATTLSLGSPHAPAEREADLAADRVLTQSTTQESAAHRVSGNVLQRAWNSCGTAEECPPRATGERARAARAALRTGTLEDPEPGFIVWGFPIGSSSTSGLSADATWTAFDAQIGRGSDRWTILGFSDCEGGDEYNSALRQRRADAAHSTLSAGARSRIGTVRGAPMEDCVGTNDTEANRAFNRAVVFQREQLGFEGETVPSIRCPPSRPTAATSLADYIALVRCAESRTGYTPRQMLAMLRQLYYGKPWSFTSTTSNWDNVITCSPHLGNPEPLLGSNLFRALGNSAEVGGVDMGHIFTGLEAMVCPQASVSFYGGLATVSTPNEDFATWAGDLGAAVAAAVACPTLGSAASTRDDCGRRAGRQPLSHYLAEHAPSQDLEGDIDPFVIRAGEMGIPCGSSGMRPFAPTRPMSDLLGDYYYDPSSRAGTARSNRNHCFLELLGATFDTHGRVNNRAAVTTGPMRDRVYQFAVAFYTNIAGFPHTPDAGERITMQLHARRALNGFITILETRAPVTP